MVPITIGILSIKLVWKPVTLSSIYKKIGIINLLDLLIFYLRAVHNLNQLNHN